MKRFGRFLVLLLVVAVVGIVVQPSAADITGTGLSGVTPSTVASGATLDITFTVDVVLVGGSLFDQETLRSFQITLPAAWTINSISPAPAATMPTSVDPSCNPAEPTTQEIAGQMVRWYGTGTDTCGPWAPGTLTFSANVTVNDCTGAPWNLPWVAAGDGYGAAPHETNGAAAVAATDCVAPPVPTDVPVPTKVPVPGPDMVAIPRGAVVGMFLVDTPAYYAPRADAATTTIMRAGKTIWVYGLDAKKAYYRVMMAGKLFWAPVNTLGPNPDAVWHNTPLPTQEAK